MDREESGKGNYAPASLLEYYCKEIIFKVRVAAMGREGERRENQLSGSVAVVVSGFRVGTMLDENFGDGWVVAEERVMERRLAFAILKKKEIERDFF